MEFSHVSVLLEECIENLNIKPDGIYVDGTLGGAGHSFEIAKRLTAGGHLYGIDQDEEAIGAATKRLEPYSDRVTIIRDNYCNMKQRLAELGVDKVDGILLDLGVSSHQLDDNDRGFSYMRDCALDMRMDKSAVKSAKEVVNEYSEAELFRIIRDYGEDQFAKNIAKHIVRMREEKTLETTFELNEAIRAAIPMKIQKTLGHPSKRTFQAIRIEVNAELDVLKRALEDMLGIMNPEGRICIITFHSLEEKIVKNCFKKWENPCTCPPDFPVCICGKKSEGRMKPKKAILPTKEEMEINSRSQSAKLRVFEKK